jgi:hypothetical protein
MKLGDSHFIRVGTPRSLSYDFWIYDYSSRLERFYIGEKSILFKKRATLLVAL